MTNVMFMTAADMLARIFGLLLALAAAPALLVLAVVEHVEGGR